jgi:hypothetical protein
MDAMILSTVHRHRILKGAVALNGFRVRLDFHDIGPRNGYSHNP